MTKREVLEILSTKTHPVSPDEVCRQLRGFHHRSSVYSYLFRLHRQGFLHRKRIGGRIAYQISQRELSDWSSSEMKSGNRAIKMIEDDELLTVEEVARLLRVPRSWVYEHSRQQSSEALPHIKLGKYLRFPKKDVLHYLEKRRQAETARGA